MSESFRPIRNSPPVGLTGTIRFFGRMLLDLQVLTVYLDLRRVLPHLTGDILDVGCGESPYRFLLDAKHVSYRGIDIEDAAKFDRHNPDVTPFDGRWIPFADVTFDALVCTEVLEHVPDYPVLVSEFHRVLKPGGKGVISVPWSARVHYAPHDYFRYTPSTLRAMFSMFTEVRIKPRGTDLSAIASKVIVLFLRSVVPRRPRNWVFAPIWLLFSPVMILAVLAGHAGVWWGVGSADDPLGYTVEVTK